MKLNRKGFTLIELIVGLGLVSIFALVAVSFLASQLKVNSTQSLISQAQSSMESTMNLIRWDIMMAGFGSSRSIIPHSGGDLNSATPDPDELEIITYFSPVGGNGHWSYTTQDVLGANDVTVRRWNDNVFSNLSVGDSVVIFNINKIKIAEARVTSVEVINTDAQRLRLSQPLSALKGTLIFALPADGSTVVDYRVVNGKLFRNGVLLQENVENLQVSYWIDNNNNGVEDAGEWQGSFSESDLPYLKLVRVTVVKLVGPDLGYSEEGKTYTIEDDNYSVGPSTSHFRRKIYTVTVKPRNMGV